MPKGKHNKGKLKQKKYARKNRIIGGNNNVVSNVQQNDPISVQQDTQQNDAVNNVQQNQQQEKNMLNKGVQMSSQKADEPQQSRHINNAIDRLILNTPEHNKHVLGGLDHQPTTLQEYKTAHAYLLTAAKEAFSEEKINQFLHDSKNIENFKKVLSDVPEQLAVLPNITGKQYLDKMKEMMNEISSTYQSKIRELILGNIIDKIPYLSFRATGIESTNSDLNASPKNAQEARTAFNTIDNGGFHYKRIRLDRRQQYYDELDAWMKQNGKQYLTSNLLNDEEKTLLSNIKGEDLFFALMHKQDANINAYNAIINREFQNTMRQNVNRAQAPRNINNNFQPIRNQQPLRNNGFNQAAKLKELEEQQRIINEKANLGIDDKTLDQLIKKIPKLQFDSSGFSGEPKSEQEINQAMNRLPDKFHTGGLFAEMSEKDKESKVTSYNNWLGSSEGAKSKFTQDSLTDPEKAMLEKINGNILFDRIKHLQSENLQKYKEQLAKLHPEQNLQQNQVAGQNLQNQQQAMPRQNSNIIQQNKEAELQQDEIAKEQAALSKRSDLTNQLIDKIIANVPDYTNRARGGFDKEPQTINDYRNALYRIANGNADYSKWNTDRINRLADSFQARFQKDLEKGMFDKLELSEEERAILPTIKDGRKIIMRLKGAQKQLIEDYTQKLRILEAQEKQKEKQVSENDALPENFSKGDFTNQINSGLANVPQSLLSDHTFAKLSQTLRDLPAYNGNLDYVTKIQQTYKLLEAYQEQLEQELSDAMDEAIENGDKPKELQDRTAALQLGYASLTSLLVTLDNMELAAKEAAPENANKSVSKETHTFVFDNDGLTAGGKKAKQALTDVMKATVRDFVNLSMLDRDEIRTGYATLIAGAKHMKENNMQLDSFDKEVELLKKSPLMDVMSADEAFKSKLCGKTPVRKYDPTKNAYDPVTDAQVEASINDVLTELDNYQKNLEQDALKEINTINK